ncbi:baseplate assembly protein [Caloramator australicus]|nr:baseplate J/gp47 family protein [Caloramator australicus]
MMIIYDLPEIDFVDKDVENIRESIITTYEALVGKTLYPGDPVRMFLETIASIIVQQRILIDMAAKQNTLRYAKGEFLDHIGALLGVLRKPATKATTILRFTISEPREEAIPIPIGTRVTTNDYDSKIYFQTTEYKEINPGELYVDVNAECTVEGEIGNGYIIGQINQIVDPFPYFESVTNITESSGGVDEEDDESFRQRIYEAPESFSTAGPEGAYISLAKQASPLICDVTVRSPSPGVVEITPLTYSGEVTQEIIDLVNAVCSSKDARPLTDNVVVRAPEKIFYDINLTYYISQENETLQNSINDAVNKAINEYMDWQKSKLGRNINPSELIKRVMQAGASRVVLNEPVFQQLELYQVAVANSVSISFGGVEDE